MMALFAVIGSNGIIVEIDECKEKISQGRSLAHEGNWLFGGTERENSEFFFEFVKKRDRETLLEIIRRRILPGSLIHSDE